MSGLGIPSSMKYESDGGPGIAAIMAFLLGSSEALKDRADFMKFMVFQWLVGATDGHAKNFSLFLLPGGSYRLTPFYDIISAFPVLGGTGLHLRDLKLSMGLNATKGRKTEINAIYPRHFSGNRQSGELSWGADAGDPPGVCRACAAGNRKRSPDAAGGLFHPRLAGHYGKYAEAARPPAARAAGVIAKPAGG